MEADFKTLAGIIGFILNGAEIAALTALLQSASLTKVRDHLAGLTQTSDFPYTKSRRKKLGWYLAGLVPLNLVNLILYGALIAVLIWGPDRLLSLAGLDTAAEPLTPGQKVIYWTWLVLAGLAYMVKCFFPSLGLIALFVKAGRWLADHQPKKKR